MCLIEKGWILYIVLCGYGGLLEGLVQVDEWFYLVLQVGDEFFLLLVFVLIWVVKDCVVGVKQVEVVGVDVILLDDGFQNLLV